MEHDVTGRLPSRLARESSKSAYPVAKYGSTDAQGAIARTSRARFSVLVGRAARRTDVGCVTDVRGRQQDEHAHVGDAAERAEYREPRRVSAMSVTTTKTSLVFGVRAIRRRTPTGSEQQVLGTVFKYSSTTSSLRRRPPTNSRCAASAAATSSRCLASSASLKFFAPLSSGGIWAATVCLAAGIATSTRGFQFHPSTSNVKTRKDCAIPADDQVRQLTPDLCPHHSQVCQAAARIDDRVAGGSGSVQNDTGRPLLGLSGLHRASQRSERQEQQQEGRPRAGGTEREMLVTARPTLDRRSAPSSSADAHGARPVAAGLSRRISARKALDMRDSASSA